MHLSIEAMIDAEAKSIGGKELTPFLLARIAEITNQQSLFSNIQLVEKQCKTCGQRSLFHLVNLVSRMKGITMLHE